MEAIDQIELFKELDKQVRAETLKREILSLDEIKFESRYAGELAAEILNKKSNYNWLKILQELYFISREIKRLVALLFILQPRINDTTQENGRYNQTTEDGYYLMFASFAHQSIYNFWDRLGDLLHIYFETGLKPERVYFGAVIESLMQKKELNEKISTQNLYNFYLEKIKPLLQTRHQVVHYFQLETKHYWENTTFRNEPERHIESNIEKKNYANLISDQLKNTAKGFYLTLKLIKDLPDKK